MATKATPIAIIPERTTAQSIAADSSSDCRSAIGLTPEAV
jgi:hypothetical protein